VRWVVLVALLACSGEVDEGATVDDSLHPQPELNIENPNFPGICFCDDSDCRQDWVDERLTCSTCATFACGSDRISICSSDCPDAGVDAG
jgi:hypothetical protein